MMLVILGTLNVAVATIVMCLEDKPLRQLPDFCISVTLTLLALNIYHN